MSGIYREPEIVTDVDTCHFYHTMEVPGYGVMQGEWDLRESADTYLGNVDFSGRRVLELGKASGFLTFHMESAGGEVVAFDLDEHQKWDVVPASKAANHRALDSSYIDEVMTWREFLDLRTPLIMALNKSFWLAHRAHGSKARLVTGSIYDIPAEIGVVDIATYGSILLHLRDPFLALYNGARLAREKVIVTDLVPQESAAAKKNRRRGWLGRRRPEPDPPFMTFIPDPKIGGPVDQWWHLSPAVVVRMLGILGFEDAEVSYSTHQYMHGQIELFTVVANRTIEQDPLDLAVT